MFHANWNGEALARSTAYVVGYHPPNFSEEYFARIDPALAVIDQSLAANDAGPVVYTTLSRLPLAWPVPPEGS
jgi:hypothetical protein